MFFSSRNHKSLIKVLYTDTYRTHIKTLLLILKASRLCISIPENHFDIQKKILLVIIKFEECITKAREQKLGEETSYGWERLRDIARYIADWMLRRSINYNRWYIAVLSYAKWPWHIKDDVSCSIPEVEKLYSNSANTIIVNDITHSARIWDFLIVDLGKITNIIETKRNWKKIMDIQKMKYQNSNAQNANVQSLKILDAFENITNENHIKNISLTRNYLDEIHDIIQKAYITWCEIEKLDDLTSVRVLYAYKKSSDAIKLTKMAHKMISKSKDEDNIYHISSFDYFAKRRNRFVTQSIAPYSIFPFSDDICINLMSGALQLSTFINVAVLKEKFEQRWWSVYKDIRQQELKSEDINASNLFHENSVDNSIFKISRDDWYFAYISIHEIFLLWLEFRKVDDLLDLHSILYEESKINKQDRKILLNFTNDNKVFY